MKQILLHAQDHVNMNGVGALQRAFRTVTSCALPLKHHFPHICISLSFPLARLVHSVDSAGIHNSFQRQNIKASSSSSDFTDLPPSYQKQEKERLFYLLVFIHRLFAAFSQFILSQCLSHSWLLLVSHGHQISCKVQDAITSQASFFFCVCLEYKTRQKYPFNL